VSDVKVFVDPAVDSERKENPFLQKLIDDFKWHKRGVLIPYFGRDASYQRPRSIVESQVLHIHILHESSRAYKTQQAAIQRGKPKDPFGLRCDLDRPEHDRALIYTVGMEHENYYCILGFFSGHAHQLAANLDTMRELAKKADRFRSFY